MCENCYGGINKITHEIKLNLFQDYDMYKQIVKELRQDKTKEDRLDTIKRHVNSCYEYLVFNKAVSENSRKEQIDYNYLLSCFKEDLEN